MVEQTTSPQLTLNDFIAVVNIIDACTERGAFKGNELLTIGTIRERLASFVKANTPQETTSTEESLGAQ